MRRRGVQAAGKGGEEIVSTGSSNREDGQSWGKGTACGVVGAQKGGLPWERKGAGTGLGWEGW